MGKQRKVSTHNINVQLDINEKHTNNSLNLFLADLIFLFHCIVILFVLFAPFTNIPAILILHIVFAMSLMVHWNANSNVCSLSIMEAHLRGLNGREETFTHKFIAPVYDISATEWSNIVWYITVIVMCISIYKLYNTDKFKNAWKCFNELEPSQNTSERLFNIINCFKPIFIME